jgi:hypothetical protein
LASAGAAFGAVILVLGAALDHFVTQPFFFSLAAGTSFVGWNPLTVVLFLYGIPYAASVAGVAGVIGALVGGGF